MMKMLIYFNLYSKEIKEKNRKNIVAGNQKKKIYKRSDLSKTETKSLIN